jgi:neutral ceramidase
MVRIVRFPPRPLNRLPRPLAPSSDGGAGRRRAAALAVWCVLVAGMPAAAEPPLRVGAAAVEIPADDAMDMAGSIHAWKASDAEAALRATAVVLARGTEKLAICSCDVLFVQRDFVEPALERVREATGIPPDRDLANHPECRLRYRLGEESSVGQNSRLLLGDGTIFWVGTRDDAVRPTGPFDTDLPVLVLETVTGLPVATLFSHATHTIGSRLPRRRSPAFYGLAAQELEGERGGTHLFLQGASGSTHNLVLGADEMVVRIKDAVNRVRDAAAPRSVGRLAALREPFDFRVRVFDEAAEEEAVTGYCRRRMASREAADAAAAVFRTQRAEIAPHQRERRTTWLQTLVVGDVAIVAVPAEFFTVLGQEIKRTSPFRDTIVAELANDWIGYVPDRRGHELGGYQAWTGHHSYCEPGTGERMVAATRSLLERLHEAGDSTDGAARR